MESLVDQELFGGIYKGRKVLVTGNTGFKGSWLTSWLSLMGSEVSGFSLAPQTTPNHFGLLDLNYNSHFADLRVFNEISDVIKQVKPEIVFHLAAQSLVRKSYEDPIETFATNVLGTLNLYEACRKDRTVKSVVTVTSDKVYENKEWPWSYREEDQLGGYDLYSSSKACVEM